jgi:magnesium transporter
MPAAKDNLNDSITRHMRTDYACLRHTQTVAEALAAIRENPPGGRIVYFYVVDEDDALVGVVPTRRLLLTPLDRRVAEIMVKEVVALPTSATVLDACEFFVMHRLLALPVVDGNRRLMGVVDVELYTDELAGIERSEQSDDLFQLIGVHLAEAQQSSPLIAFRQRFPWLLCNIAGGILAAFLSGIFATELQKLVALAMFVPVVLALAESVSVQSVSLALYVLRGKQPTVRDALSRMRSEALAGLLLGAASASAVGLVAFAWLRQGRFVLCLFGGIFGGVAAAALIGAAIPNLLRLIRRDPQVAAGPIALAMSDLLTLLVYFSLARWLTG